MKLKLIVAFDEVFNIGIDNNLIWDIKEDLELFKKHTKNCVVVMGQKTFESIGRCLPDRINVVLSDDEKWIENQSWDDVESGKLRLYSNFNVLLERLKEVKDKDIFIIGGRRVYKTFLNRDLIDELYISHIKGKYDGNVKFPYIDFKDWKVVEKKEYKDFIFKKYVKK